MELGHWVTGSMGHLSRPGHRVIFLTRCETRVFPVFEKNAQNAKRTFEMLKWQKSLSCVCCWTEITGCQSMQWTFTFTVPMIITNSLAWEYFFAHKSTFGVHYRTGLPGQLGLRVAGFPGHWVAGSQKRKASFTARKRTWTAVRDDLQCEQSYRKTCVHNYAT